MKISASFLSCKKIEDGIKKLSLTDVDFIHVDFVDGKFTKGREIPFRKLKKIYKYTSKRLDVHLMVSKPSKYIKKFSSLNVQNIIFPVEVEKGITQNIDLVHSFGIKCGLAINPKTDISKLEPYLDKIDLILVMGIEPGYGGQAFIEDTVSKVQSIKEMVSKSGHQVLLSVDGGINDEVIKKINDIDIVVAGSFITNFRNFQEQVDKLRGKKVDSKGK